MLRWALPVLHCAMLAWSFSCPSCSSTSPSSKAETSVLVGSPRFKTEMTTWKACHRCLSLENGHTYISNLPSATSYHTKLPTQKATRHTSTACQQQGSFKSDNATSLPARNAPACQLAKHATVHPHGIAAPQTRATASFELPSWYKSIGWESESPFSEAIYTWASVLPGFQPGGGVYVDEASAKHGWTVLRRKRLFCSNLNLRWRGGT
ncbi:hypothetical protein BDP81DRAFT_426188 [Colletotrichum phormii]|uniref:Secreted protein n=1 Tax=Colletotrichum phormii TaxID=359342 RepID=A0AAI9ZTP2_9PEZI|nr:uncharacterized protein BDP81DRAFT_426188 [Colletotrichum phormii]KAK1637933.1 hypothetical protein BDP81DRAFT_426188 [Colletotrichum phormii]